jgi:hypothetical protein
MTQLKDAGLAAIAQSTRKTSVNRPAPQKPLEVTKPPLIFEGRRHKTSIAMDGGLWNCLFDLGHAMTKRFRAKGQGRVHPVDILEAAFIKFYELPLEEQLELVRRYRDR